MTPRFDPTRAIIYDLAMGQLKDDEGVARLNLPFHLLLRLCEQAGADAAADFAQSLGGELGRRVQDRLGKQTGTADMAAWAEHLGGQLALVGLGGLQIERWGRALVLRMAGAPEGASALLASVLTGALQRGLGRDMAAVAFEDDETIAYLILSRDSAARARNLREAGQGLGQVVEQLHRGAA
jgi:hypothetical protein